MSRHVRVFLSRDEFFVNYTYSFFLLSLKMRNTSRKKQGNISTELFFGVYILFFSGYITYADINVVAIVA